MNKKNITYWIKVYEDKYGVNVSLFSFHKRRNIAGIGEKIGSKWYFTWDEFLQVLNTPLFGCKKVVKYGNDK